MQTSYVKQIKEYNIRQAWPLTEKSALLVIDMQCYFASIAQPILGNVISIIECFRANKRKSSSPATVIVILTQTGACSVDGGVI